MKAWKPVHQAIRCLLSASEPTAICYHQLLTMPVPTIFLIGDNNR
jgi:hypothetical protein